MEKKQQYYIILFTILSVGVALRIFHYLYNRSLWMDEIYLSSSFSHLSYSDLASKVLDYDQKAPIGFLVLVKASVSLFGFNEPALRLIPLMAGIASLFCFNRVCRYFLQPWAQIAAVLIFALSPAMIYHATEIKQYSAECLATVAALCLFCRYKDSLNWRSRILWGISGAVLLWFSFSVIFILAGIACGSSLYDLLKKNYRSFLINAVPFVLWLLSFILNYLLFTHKHAESEWVVYFFRLYDNFMPFPPHSLQELKWFPRNFIDMMDYPLGLVWNLKSFSTHILVRLLAVPVLPAILLFGGLFSWYRHSFRNFLTLLFPVLFMLVASGLDLYPLIERFWVFIAPVFILFIAAGFEYFQQRIRRAGLVWIVFLLLISSPVVQAAYFLVQPGEFYKHKKSHEKEALAYINSQLKKGDAVYNYWNNAPGYRVYQHICRYKYTAVQGRDLRKQSADLQDYNHNLKTDFQRFAGSRRVWIIYNRQFLTDIGDLADDPKWYYRNRYWPLINLQQQIRQLGKPLKKFEGKDVSVYLVELKPEK